MSIARYYIRRFALRNRFAADLKYLLIASANILNQPERKNKAKPVEMAFVRYAFPFDVLLQSRLGLVGRYQFAAHQGFVAGARHFIWMFSV